MEDKSKEVFIDVTRLSVDERSEVEKVLTECAVVVGTLVVIVITIPALAIYWAHCKATGHKSRVFCSK